MKRTPFKRKMPLRARGGLHNTGMRRAHKGFYGKDSKFKNNPQYDWRFWQLRCWGLFLTKKLGHEEVNLPCMCGCGRRSNLVADHVMPRSNFRGDNWDPCNGQIIHWALNSEKGSQHGPKWDFRSKEYKEFQERLRDKDWIHDPLDGWLVRKKENPS